jgi:hypothetical protein
MVLMIVRNGSFGIRSRGNNRLLMRLQFLAVTHQAKAVKHHQK